MLVTIAGLKRSVKLDTMSQIITRGSFCSQFKLMHSLEIIKPYMYTTCSKSYCTPTRFSMTFSSTVAFLCKVFKNCVAITLNGDTM